MLIVKVLSYGMCDKLLSPLYLLFVFIKAQKRATVAMRLDSELKNAM